MARLLNSVFSDPIGAAMRTGSEMANLIDNIQDAPIKRKLQQMEMQKEQMQLDQMQQRAEGYKKLTGLLETTNPDTITALTKYPALIDKITQAKKDGKDPKFSGDDLDILTTVGAHSNHLPDDPAEVPARAQATKDLLDFSFLAKDSLRRKVKLDNASAPKIIGDLNAVVLPEIKKRSDDDDHDWKINAAFINMDPKDPLKSTMALSLMRPFKEGTVLGTVGGDPYFTVNPELTGKKGMEQGNIDLSKRPVVENVDGSVSTVQSISFNEDGKEVLAPMIKRNGKVMKTREEAIDEYHKTGDFLAKGDSVADINAYAEQLHKDQEEKTKKYDAQGQEGRTEGLTYGKQNQGDKGVVVQFPVALLQAKLQAAQKWYGAFQQAYAAANPEEAAKMYMDKVEQSKLDRAVYQAFASTPEGLTSEQQRKHLLSHKPEGMSMLDWAKNITSMWPTMNPYQAGTLAERTRHDVAMENKPEKPGAEYKTRRIQKGDQEIDQESQDGGKTWTTIGGGPKFKPRQAGETPEDKKQEKEQKRIDTEVDKGERSREVERSKDTANKEQIDKDHDEAIQLIKDGKVRTWGEAKNHIDQKRDKSEKQVKDIQTSLEKQFPADQNKGKKKREPSTGAEFESRQSPKTKKWHWVKVESAKAEE